MLTTALEQSLGRDVHVPAGRDPQEVGAVAYAHRNLAPICHGATGTGSARALDEARIDAAADCSPLGLVIRSVVGMGRSDVTETASIAKPVPATNRLTFVGAASGGGF